MPTELVMRPKLYCILGWDVFDATTPGAPAGGVGLDHPAGTYQNRHVGSGVFVVPAWVTHVTVSLMGGGGGGGGGDTAGGGGGVGGDGVTAEFDVTPGDHIPFVIGAAGVTAGATLDGTGGGDTTMTIGLVDMLAAGGGGGHKAVTTTPGAANTATSGSTSAGGTVFRGGGGGSGNAAGGGGGGGGGGGVDGAGLNGVNSSGSTGGNGGTGGFASGTGGHGGNNGGGGITNASLSSAGGGGMGAGGAVALATGGQVFITWDAVSAP